MTKYKTSDQDWSLNAFGYYLHQFLQSTPMAAVTKFALKGNRRDKKDLGMQAMAYGDVYVASVAMGADYNQSLKAFRYVRNAKSETRVLDKEQC